jgi:enoyl-CoA hydratase
MLDMTPRQAVTILRMAHGQANALDVEWCQGLTARLAPLSTAASGAVVLVGTGTMLSAGVDLLRVLNEGVA